MQIKLEKVDVSTIKAVDRNTVEFSLHSGQSVQVGRRFNGWAVNLTITIDGIRWHDSEATKADKVMFEDLASRAFDNLHEAQKSHGVLVSQLASGLFTLD